MVTTNQIRTWAKHNQYVSDYYTEHDCNLYYRKLKRMPHINDRGWETDIYTYQSNRRYFLAHTEFHRKFGHIDNQTFHKVEFEEFIWRYSVIIRINGTVRVTISSCEIDDESWLTKLPFFDGYNFCFLYNGKLSPDEFDKAVIKEINKYMYPDGLFRRIQSYYGCTKEMALLFYKKLKPDLKGIGYDEYDIEKHISRYYNIDTSHVGIESAIRWINKHGKKFKERVVLMKFDFSFMYSFDGDIDEAEDLFWDEMKNYPKNCILI